MSPRNPVSMRARTMVVATVLTLAGALLPLGLAAAADPLAPIVTTPVLSTASTYGAAEVTVTAAATDDVGVAGAELSVDGGLWTAMSATGGAFGDASVALTGTVGASGVSAMAIGDYNGCALLGDAILRCWGQNSFHQFGEPTNVHRPRAVAIPGLSGVTAVAMGHWHACALMGDTTVQCWGNNFAGQLGDGTAIPREGPVEVAGLVGVSSISAGFAHTCAVLADTTVECWGFNSAAELGDGTTTHRYQPVPVQAVSGVVAVAAGGSFTCALLADTTVRCWGLNQSGQIGNGTTTTMELNPVAVPGLAGVVALTPGWGHMCALMSDATVRCWGANVHGQVGDGSLTNQPSPVAIPDLVDVTLVDAGATHTCALLADATARCWGANGTGALGDGSLTSVRLAPVPVEGLTQITAIAAGDAFSCAQLMDGSIQCWGANAQGRLGDGTETDRLSPTPVAGLRGALSGGPHQVCVRATDTEGNTSDGSACATLTIRYGHTEVGRSISVRFADDDGGASSVMAIFEEVSVEGESAVSTSSTGPATPASFVFGDPPIYYTLSTTAAFTTAQVCIDYDDGAFVDDSELRMYQFRGADWVEVTYTRDPSRDIVCGHQIQDFAPIVVVEYRYGDTPTGASVDVTFADASGAASPVSATFLDVTVPGQSTIAVDPTGPTPPATFRLGDPPVFYTLSTTATFASATVCIDVGGVFYEDLSSLRLLHFEGGAWIDVTSSFEPWSTRVCGVVTSFSPFIVAQLEYAFTGFFAPIDNQPVRNAAKAGSAIPIKFNLGGDAGLDIFAAGYPKVEKVTCDTQSPLDEIEEIVPAGQSGLSFDRGSGRYTYIWKTDARWAGTCRQLVVRLADQTEYRANFTFRK